MAFAYEREPQVRKPAGQNVKPDADAGSGSPTGQFARRRTSSVTIQAKLSVGPAGDPLEREADRVAAEVMRDIQRRPDSSNAPSALKEPTGSTRIQPMVRASSGGDVRSGQHAVDRRDDTVRPVLRKADVATVGRDGGQLDDDTDGKIRSAKGGGSALEPNVRRSMEDSFGADFSGVRVHDNRNSDELNSRIQAKAFTTGNDIFFGGGRYSPESSSGQELIAHELAHVVQQGGAPTVRRDLDDRATSWEAIDQAANEKRLAHAKDGYLFDQSLKSEGEDQAAMEARLAEQKSAVAENDVSDETLAALPQVFKFLYAKNPSLAMQQFGYSFNSKQQATISARLKAKDNIPKPTDLFDPAVVEKHLGKFANGAHAFIDPDSSKKIEDEITDARFKGWGIDANFVAPLDEANALNAQAHKERGIETIEDELGIPKKYWSKSAWNPEKYLVRWVIPKPKLKMDEGEAGLLLEMATGSEWKADAELWVAGGLTKGGASEAVVKAIPREALIKHLAEGTIKQKKEFYPETRDNIE